MSSDGWHEDFELEGRRHEAQMRGDIPREPDAQVRIPVEGLLENADSSLCKESESDDEGDDEKEDGQFSDDDTWPIPD